MPVGAIPFPFGVCRICKDKATGVHYGVVTCEGCKGFFKRSITRGDKYKCFFGGDCDLTPKNRNRCKSCRFKKCLDVGMSVEAVRMGRIPKVDKEKALEVFHRGGSNFNNLEIEVEMTGSGTYDFKINPKDETGSTAQQSNGESRVPGWSAHQEPVAYKSGNTQSVPGKMECDSEKHPGMFELEKKTAYPDDAAMEMSDVNRQFSAVRFPGTFPGFDSYTSCHRNPYNMNSSTTISSLGQRPSIRSETISSCEHINSGENKFSDFRREDNSVHRYYDERQSDRKDLNMAFATCDTDNKIPSLGRNNMHRWHSLDSQLNSHNPPELTWDNSNHEQSSYQPTDFAYASTNAGHLAQTQLGPGTNRDVDKKFLHWCSSLGKQAPGTLDIPNNSQERERQFCRPFQPDFQEQFQQFVEKESPFREDSFAQCIPNKHNNPEQTFEAISGDLKEKCNNVTDSKVQCEAFSQDVENVMQRDENSCKENCNMKQRNYSEKGKLDMHHESQNGMSDVSPIQSPTYTQSFENLKFSSPGSVISSNEGSNSSQRSGYSPAVIQLLLDQVVEFDQGQNFAIKLKHKFEQMKADQTVVQRVLNLVNEAAAKAKRKEVNDDSQLRLDKLPENKLESMNRFLNDLHDNFDNESPLIKKKRISEAHSYESFENAGDERCAKLQTVLHRGSCHNGRTDRNRFVPQAHQDLSNPIVNMSLNKNVMNGYVRNHSVDVSVPVGEKLKMATQSFQVCPHVTSDSPVVQVPSADFSLNQNSHNHQQHVLNSQKSSCQSQAASTNPHTQFKVSQNSSQKSMTDHALFRLEQSYTADTTVTSTNRPDENSKNMDEMLKTIDCMSLGVKILNRFKPEHREKIRLYKQGQLHLRTMTDSDEDCAAIYEKLMQGIPGLNDRIIGFCDSVPGFLDIPKEDKEKLIKRSYYDMWTLSYAEYFQNGESFWILPSGEIYSAQAMRKILNDEMVDTIMQFSDEFNSLELTDLETAIFAAIRLTTAAGVDLEEKTKVKHLNAHLLDTLGFEMERNRPNQYAQLLVHVFNLVPLIEAINRIQSQIIANFSVKRFKKAANAGKDGEQI